MHLLEDNDVERYCLDVLHRTFEDSPRGETQEVLTILHFVRSDIGRGYVLFFLSSQLPVGSERIGKHVPMTTRGQSKAVWGQGS